MRGFVAIEAESATTVSERFSELVRELKKEIGAKRATYPREFHITLKFMGEFDEAQPLLLERIKAALAAACAGVKMFSLDARGVGCFPSPNNPRVVFASVEDDRLAELAARVESGMEKLGFAREDRKFSGHITLARLKEPANLAGFFEKYDNFYFGAMEIKRVKLKKSTLTSAGPVYEDVCSVELMGDR